MLNLKKSLKLAGVLAVVLGAAAPMMTTSASAEPYRYDHSYRYAQSDYGYHGYRHDRREFYGDRYEHRGFERHDWHRWHHDYHRGW